MTGSSFGDILTGSSGNNIIIGGAGADNLNGGTGTDTLSYAGSTAAVTVNLAANTASGGDATGDIIVAGSFENLTGSSFGDILTGNSGNNTLVGNGGTDYLNGYGTVANFANSQIDVLTGGSEADFFILGGSWGVSYVEQGDGYATILDWNSASDWIQVLGGSNSYRIDVSRNVLGGSSFDAEIYHVNSNDRIAVIQDSTNIDFSRFTYV